MRLILSVSFLVLLVSENILAQKTSISFSTGYAFPAAKRTLVTTRGNGNFEAVLGSYGSGLNFNMGIERSVGKYLNVGLDASYSLGNKIKGETTAYLYALQANLTSKSDNFYFIPYLYSIFPSNSNTRLYVNWGLVISQPNVTNDYFVRANNQNSVFTEELSHKLSVGTRFGSGLAFTSGLNDNVTFTFGFELIALSPVMDELVLTEYFLNGVDQMPGYGSSPPKIIYKKDGKIGTPNTQPADTSPFSSFGLKFGCKFKLTPKP